MYHILYLLLFFCNFIKQVLIFSGNNLDSIQSRSFWATPSIIFIILITLLCYFSKILTLSLNTDINELTKKKETFRKILLEKILSMFGGFSTERKYDSSAGNICKILWATGKRLATWFYYPNSTELNESKRVEYI